MVIAAPTEPTRNTRTEATYRDRRPQTSDIRPTNGMAATYPSRYPVMVQEARSSSLICTRRSSIISGSTVTMTVWSSAAINTPSSTGSSARYLRLSDMADMGGL